MESNQPDTPVVNQPLDPIPQHELDEVPSDELPVVEAVELGGDHTLSGEDLKRLIATMFKDPAIAGAYGLIRLGTRLRMAGVAQVKNMLAGLTDDPAALPVVIQALSHNAFDKELTHEGLIMEMTAHGYPILQALAAKDRETIARELREQNAAEIAERLESVNQLASDLAIDWTCNRPTIAFGQIIWCFGDKSLWGELCTHVIAASKQHKRTVAHLSEQLNIPQTLSKKESRQTLTLAAPFWIEQADTRTEVKRCLDSIASRMQNKRIDALLVDAGDRLTSVNAALETQLAGISRNMRRWLAKPGTIVLAYAGKALPTNPKSGWYDLLQHNHVATLGEDGLLTPVTAGPSEAHTNDEER